MLNAASALERPGAGGGVWAPALLSLEGCLPSPSCSPVSLWERGPHITLEQVLSDPSPPPHTSLCILTLCSGDLQLPASLGLTGMFQNSGMLFRQQGCAGE